MIADPVSDAENPWPDPCALPDAVDELGLGIHPLSTGTGATDES